MIQILNNKAYLLSYGFDYIMHRPDCLCVGQAKKLGTGTCPAGEELLPL